MDNIHENKATGEVVIMHVRKVSMSLNEANTGSSKYHPVTSYPLSLLPEYLLQDVLCLSFYWLRKLSKRTKSQDSSQIKTTVKSGAGARVYWKVPLGKTWSDIVHSKEKLTVTCLKELGV